jgi:biotin-dependent carboxylase-like uncharacterized protein
MGVMRVVEPGMFTTVQDLGRSGWAAIGVAPGGAVDALSLRVGNRLVGNADGAASLEMTMVGGTFDFEQDATIVVAGGEVSGSVGGGGAARTSEMARPMEIRRGERLRLGPITRGVRAYLCVRGGIMVESVLGSASTHAGAGFGGVQGRALRRGDVVEIGPARGQVGAGTPWARAGTLVDEALERRTLRAVEGAQIAAFAGASASAFWSSEFVVSSQSDRVGLRLQGRIGAANLGGRMASEGMMFGAVQVPEGGEPIVLMADHPTTGGYPVIACVATVDLPSLGQLRPGDRVRFERVTAGAARELFRERERALNLEIAPV